MEYTSKRILHMAITICLFVFTITMAQNIINKIGGTSENEEFHVTDNEGNVKFYVKGNGNTGVNGNISVSGTGMWHHSGAVVYDNLPAPTSWTDLDLSSVVGANNAFVMLKVKNWSTGGVNIYFRPDGDSDSYSNEGFSYPSGAHAASLRPTAPGFAALVICETASNGYVEWKTNAENVSVWVLGYIK